MAVGDEVRAIDGQVPRDIIEWRFLVDEADPVLDLERGGLEQTLEVHKRAGEPLGVEVQSALFDQVRTCDNHCEFCFIYQLPPGLRKSLYLKDDDYRLSFLYGNFTTLTRFTESDLERVVTERLSPINVSIHATDPEVRTAMLRNRRGATSLRWLRSLLDHDIEVHGQVVVCPGINDGAVLDDTLAGVLDRFPDLASLCVVPLGVSRYNEEPRMRPHTVPEAAAVVDCVEDWQDVFLRVLGRRLVFVGDEYYLLAERPFPSPEAYEGFAMHEDGVGMARTLELELFGHKADATGKQDGFFSWADSSSSADADYEPYRGARATAGQLLQVRPSRARARRHPHGHLRRARAGAAAHPARSRRRARRSGRQPVLRRHHRRHRLAGGGGPRPHPRRRTGGPPLPAARRLPVQRPLPRRHRPRGPAPPGRGHPDRRARAARRPRHRRPDAGGRTMTLPTVAIVGRPNVGKSTLVNRIVGSRVTIVEEKPGVTRDRKEVEADWQGVPFMLVDTGGWMPGGDSLDAKVSRQSEQAIRDADAVILVMDAITGVTEEDSRVAEVIRNVARGKVLLVVNKVDDANREGLIWEALSLGLGDPLPISALHGRGAGDLLDRLVEVLPQPAVVPEPGEDDEVPEEERVFSVALVGRPNVGKSTLFNRLIGEDRAVVHDLPGTTRDTIDTIVETDDGPIRFVDTAGMRRKAKIDEATEYYSLVRALQAVDKADVALLIIDSTVGVTAQDQRLAERIDAAGSPVVVLLNKHELLTDAEARADLDYQVAERLRFIGEAPVLKISALTGKGVKKLMPALSLSIEDYHRRVPTRRVNEVIRAAQQAQPGPHGVKVLYATQAAVDPPTFTLFANREVPATYLRYLERSLREGFDLGHTPIKMRVRKRS